MDEETGPLRNRYRVLTVVGIVAWIALIIYLATFSNIDTKVLEQSHDTRFYFPAGILVLIVCLLSLSAFFSASETAFLSINKIRLLSMIEDRHLTARLVADMMTHPGKFLTMILVGNMIVNILISVVLGSRVVKLFMHGFDMSPIVSYTLAVAICTSVLLFFGEIVPKIFAMRMGERLARFFSIPLLVTDKILGVVREVLLVLADSVFRMMRFKELRAVPFMTDDEFMSLLSHSKAHGVIEEEQRQMIQGILEFTDATLREILVPRPDVIALSAEATVSEALKLLKDHEYSRIPVYRDDLDHIFGVLFAKDLLVSVDRGELSKKVGAMVKPIQFVPETMSVHSFVKFVQRKRRHIAVVVDEYGGTEGIVTLEDALEEVVGEIFDEDESQEVLYEKISPGDYRIDGSMPLDEFKELLGIDVEDEEHETIAGFVMSKIDKIPEDGDRINHSGLIITVESVDSKRVETLHVKVQSKVSKENVG